MCVRTYIQGRAGRKNAIGFYNGMVAKIGDRFLQRGPHEMSVVIIKGKVGNNKRGGGNVGENPPLPLEDARLGRLLSVTPPPPSLFPISPFPSSPCPIEEG